MSENDFMANMTIEQAIGIYKDFHSDFYLDEKRILDKIKSQGKAFEVSNHNYLHAMFLTEWMFQSTNKTLEILAGNFLGGFLEVLEESFRGALQRIQEKGGIAKMIIAGSEKPAIISNLENKFDNFNVIVTQPAKPGIIEHFIVSDVLHVRAEKPHQPLRMQDSIDKIIATIYINNRAKAESLSKRFNKLWDMLDRRG